MVAAARSLLDEDGASGVTVRAVARSLGVHPNAVYTYTADRDQLLDRALDDLLGDIDEPATAAPIAGLIAMMEATYDVLVAHPGAVEGYVQRQGARGDNAQRLGRRMDTWLTDLDIDDVDAARSVLIVHAIGAAAFAVGGSFGSPDPDSARSRFQNSLRWLISGITSSG